MRIALLGISLFLIAVASGCGDDKSELILGATTSAQDTGILDELVEAFEAHYDYDVKQVVGGSGQTLELAREGEMDVIMTHSPADEDTFIADGYGIDKRKVMQNYFVIAGPEGDPAGVGDAPTMKEAFEKIADGEYGFVSRGDNSGTHRREQSIWESAAIDPVGKSWYTESATGQGLNLLVANDSDAYTLVDSSTFIAFLDRLEIVELFRDEEKPNVYSVIRLNPEKLAKVNSEGGDAWLQFMNNEGQDVIAEFGREQYGDPLFEPLAR